MTSDRIDEILKQTAYPESASNRSALLQVWNECGHYYKSEINELKATIQAQEIIIKDKSAIMEAMAQPKTCDGCIHFRTCNEVDVMCVRYYELTDKYEPKTQP